MSIYVDGSAARQLETEPVRKELTEREKAELRRKRAAAVRREQRQQRKQTIMKVLVTAPIAMILIGMVLITLNGTIKSNELMDEISSLESEYSELQAQNDSKEYDINRSVDLGTVVQVATEELGMVRSSAGQIITYKTSESEYIQQMAEIPAN